MRLSDGREEFPRRSIALRIKEMIGFALLETEGDREDFRRIYEENYLKMYHVALGMLKQPQAAEDAVHEAFAALAERFGRYCHLGDKEMAGFCVSVVKNKAIDYIRKAKHYSETELEELVLSEQDGEYDLVLALVRSEERDLIKDALWQISEIYRETLILKYYYELCNTEIAKIQNVTKKTVEMRLYRGRQKLKEVLHGMGE